MQTNTSLTEPPKTNRHLARAAVQRTKGLSVESGLERLFAMAFNGLVYPQIWEDPEVDMAAMAIEPHHHIVTISSGGCNALSYLAANPAKITAVDLSTAHIALLNLKVAALRHLPDWKSFYRFFGEAKSAANIDDYHVYLRDHLDAATISYWEGRLKNGRQRLSRFKGNLYRSGVLGRFIAAGHFYARMKGKKLSDLTKCKTQAEQKEFFDREIAPLFDARFVKWLISYRASLFGLGIPPSQYEALAGGQPMVKVLLQRLEKLACGFPMAENYFAWQAFGRSYAPNASGALPPYLQMAHFNNLQKRANRVNASHMSITDKLEQQKPGSVHRVVLLDAQDWMTDDQLNALWSAITKAAAPDARVIFRTAGTASILPGRVNPLVLNQWTYQEEQSAAFTKQDRSSIYGGFHAYHLTKG